MFNACIKCNSALQQLCSILWFLKTGQKYLDYSQTHINKNLSKFLHHLHHINESHDISETNSSSSWFYTFAAVSQCINIVYFKWHSNVHRQFKLHLSKFICHEFKFNLYFLHSCCHCVYGPCYLIFFLFLFLDPEKSPRAYQWKP